jgi:hypothetical protein
MFHQRLIVPQGFTKSHQAFGAVFSINFKAQFEKLLEMGSCIVSVEQKGGILTAESKTVVDGL